MAKTVDLGLSLAHTHTICIYIDIHTRAVKIAQKLHSNIPFKKTHIFEHIRISVCALGTSITGQINTSRDITTCISHLFKFKHI